MKAGRALAVVAAIGAGFGIHGCFSGSRLPPAADHAHVQPDVSRIPDDLRVCWAEFARTGGPAWPLTTGPTRTKRFDGTASGLLIRHPQGNVLVDAGNSSNLREEWKDYPFVLRKKLDLAPGKMAPIRTHAEALAMAGVTAADLRWILISHIHADHAGGIVDLPDVPVLAAGPELEFTRRLARSKTLHVIPAHAAALEGRSEALVFDDGPYENFDASEDLFGDGSVVVVPLYGHTPGSVGTFVNLPDGRRLLHVGDAVMLSEAITARASKGVLVRELDHDFGKANEVLRVLSQLAVRVPALTILPAHDRPAWSAFFGEPGCPPE